MSGIGVTESSNQHGKHEVDRNNKDNGCAGCLFLAALLAIALTGLFAAGRSAILRAQDFADSAELTQIEQAISSYAIKFGSPPPNPNVAEITTHFTATRNTEIGHSMAIDSIDETESLIFWLSGGCPAQAENESIFYDVDPLRTTDLDGDGFLEYNSPYRGVFIIRNGVPMLLDRSDGSTKSSGDSQFSANAG